MRSQKTELLDLIFGGIRRLLRKFCGGYISESKRALLIVESEPLGEFRGWGGGEEGREAGGRLRPSGARSARPWSVRIGGASSRRMMTPGTLVVWIVPIMPSSRVG